MSWQSWQTNVAMKMTNVSRKNMMHRCNSREPKMHTRKNLMHRRKPPTSPIWWTQHAQRKGVRRAKAKAKQKQPGRVIPSRE